jgi:hypothetical protein
MSLPISDGLVTPKATGRIKRIAWSSVGIELSMAFRTVGSWRAAGSIGAGVLHH